MPDGIVVSRLLSLLIRSYRYGLSPLLGMPAVSIPPAPHTRWRLSNATAQRGARGLLSRALRGVIPGTQVAMTRSRNCLLASWTLSV